MHFRPDAGDRDSSDPLAEVQDQAASTNVSPFASPLGRNGGAFVVDPDLVATDNEENLRGFIKTRGSLVPGEEFVFWWVGDIYDLVEEQSARHLFSFEGYNIGRMVRVDGGWRMLTREVGIYKDPQSGEILDTWQNPYTGSTNTCVHVWNDPVNQEFLLNSQRGKFKVPTTRSGDDMYWHAEVFLKYKSPISRSEYPDNVASDMYQSAEMFQFFTKASELRADEPSADCQISWVRVGQWLPWMEMGDTPGRLVYHCRGKRLEGGYNDLSNTVRDFIERDHPEYASAPVDFTTPNETSWTYMRKLLEAKGSPRADGTVARPEPVVAHLVHPTPSKASSRTVHSSSKTASTTNNGPETPMTASELAMYDGHNVDAPIYLCVGGRIFDVSTSRRHYRKGETYNCLTGKDATYAFISGDLSEAGLESNDKIDMHNLTEEQSKDLEHWIGFFAKTYPQVGKLVGSDF